MKIQLKINETTSIGNRFDNVKISSELMEIETTKCSWEEDFDTISNKLLTKYIELRDRTIEKSGGGCIFEEAF